jgi:hypothetical protein
MQCRFTGWGFRSLTSVLVSTQTKRNGGTFTRSPLQVTFNTSVTTGVSVVMKWYGIAAVGIRLWTGPAGSRHFLLLSKSSRPGLGLTHPRFSGSVLRAKRGCSLQLTVTSIYCRLKKERNYDSTPSHDLIAWRGAALSVTSLSLSLK